MFEKLMRSQNNVFPNAIIFIRDLDVENKNFKIMGRNLPHRSFRRFGHCTQSSYWYKFFLLVQLFSIGTIGRVRRLSIGTNSLFGTQISSS